MTEILQLFVLATSRTPLRHVWRLGYVVARRVAAGRLAHEFSGSVFVRGSSGSIVPGLSDIDLVVASPQDESCEYPDTVHRLGGLVQAEVASVAEIESLAGSTFWTFGLATGRAAFHGPTIVKDPLGMLDRPGLDAEPASWRHAAGPEFGFPPVVRDRQAVREAALCELVTWWRFAFRAIARESPQVSDPYLCVKLVADPLRILLALRGRLVRRADALRLGPSLVPELTDEIEHAIDLLRRLPERPPAPFAASLPALVDLSRTIVAEIGSELPEGESVRLVTGETEGGLPLCDWRALVAEGLPGLVLQQVDRDPRDLADLRAACLDTATDCVRVIVSDGLLLEPTAQPFWDGRMRTLHAAFTDPVSAALLQGSSLARFPGVRGWSARDWARRAVAERRAWLAAPGGRQPEPRSLSRPPDPEGCGPDTAVGLLGCTRAAQFALSLAGGKPELRLDARSVVEAAGAPAAAVLARLERADVPRAADVIALRAEAGRELDRAWEALG